MSEVIIETQGLTRYFNGIVAVDHLDLRVMRGEVFGFLGPNGAGKTTTIRLLNGVLTPTSGTMRVAGFDPVREGSEVRRRTGVLTETPALYEQLSGRENLRVFGTLYGLPESTLHVRVEEVLETFGLTERADDKAGSYSKGMKQRLVLARALIHKPALLFLDEPTAGLDPAAARQVTELIEELSHKEARTVFLCTHNLFEAQRLCDRVGIINKGRLLAVGTPAALASKLQHGHWVEVELAEAPTTEFLTRICEGAGILDVNADGRCLNVHLDDRERTPALVSAMVAAGARIYRVMPHEYSLEEVYFALQKESEATR